MDFNKVKGFTLIEVMITIVIVSILASLATVSYRSYIVKARRQDVQEHLIMLQQSIEEFYALNHTYADALTPIQNYEGIYTIVYSTKGTGGYRLTATAIGSQSSDTECRVIVLTRAGAKSGGPNTGALVDDACW